MPADETPWNRRGLPPAATARLERTVSSGVKGSLLSAPDAAALAAVGFEPVGEVMGCIVQQIGWMGYGVPTVSGAGYHVVTSGSGRRWAGVTPYVTALYRGWDTALHRMMAEAGARGADGVVGVRLTETLLDQSNREFVTLGTAVRGLGRTRATRPFATDLSGADTSKLLHAGWVPTGIAIGISVGIGFYGMNRTARQAGYWQPSNWQATAEVEGYTQLINDTRHDARRQFERRAVAHGGEAALVSRMRLRAWGGENPSDASGGAEAIILGTAATAFHRGRTAPSTSLSIMPLGRPSGRTKENRR